MSKIMRQLYAEARAAREAAERATPCPAGKVEGAAPKPTPSSIDWWKAKYEQAGRVVVTERSPGGADSGPPHH